LIEIRALRHEDRDAMVAAVDSASDQSIYRRFFGARRHFTEQEISFFVDVDFLNHVALVAVIEENERPEIVGGCRYVVTDPGRAEIAFAVIDRYQGQGVGAILMKHIGILARAAGLRELIAEVLPENAPMLKVFRHSGFSVTTAREPGVIRVALRLH
jgi:RimJ/RimL family protein N-acetyltransferase